MRAARQRRAFRRASGSAAASATQGSFSAWRTVQTHHAAGIDIAYPSSTTSTPLEDTCPRAERA